MKKKNLPISEIMRIREIELGETASEIVNKKNDTSTGNYERCCFLANQTADKIYGRSDRRRSQKAESPRSGEKRSLRKSASEGNYLCYGYTGNECLHGLIVASPTAGSAGIVPGLMLAMQEHYQFSDEEIIRALFNASAIGYLAMRNATVAGAVGGCQAEVGVASAMAASAAVELMGGSPKECTFASSTVLMNMLGLVCDPVGGLVEYPCQNRNAAGVANAIIAAEMALAGIPQLIPLDEMIQTMFTVGKKLPAELRETAMGGCATTPSACEACHICS